MSGFLVEVLADKLAASLDRLAKNASLRLPNEAGMLLPLGSAQGLCLSIEGGRHQVVYRPPCDKDTVLSGTPDRLLAIIMAAVPPPYSTVVLSGDENVARVWIDQLASLEEGFADWVETWFETIRTASRTAAVREHLDVFFGDASSSPKHS